MATVASPVDPCLRDMRCQPRTPGAPGAAATAHEWHSPIRRLLNHLICSIWPGLSALFFGPNGTGKTMAAMGVARSLGIQLLRFDQSRIVSKYIGDTEKNIDRVFSDPQRSGSAILINEADALLGKRSEVKDAHVEEIRDAARVIACRHSAVCRRPVAWSASGS